MKRLTAIILAMLLTLTLTACGGSSASTDPNAGVYNCTGVETMGITMTAEEAFEGASSLELMDGGKGKINLGGTTGSVKWTLDGTALSVEIEGETGTGTLENGVIVLDLGGLGVEATFVKEGAEAPATSAK